MRKYVFALLFFLTLVSSSYAQTYDTLRVERCSIGLYLSIDNSGSMANSWLQSTMPFKETLQFSDSLYSKLVFPKDTCYVQYCDTIPFPGKTISQTYFNPRGYNDFYNQLMDSTYGIINLAKHSTKEQKIVVLMTDAQCDLSTKMGGQLAINFSSSQLQQCIDTCLKYGIRFFAVYPSTEDTNKARNFYYKDFKHTLQVLADTTGGQTFYTVVDDVAIDSASRMLFSDLDRSCASQNTIIPCGENILLKFMEGERVRFSIAPNPSQGSFCINSNRNGTFEIYNINGVKEMEGITNEIVLTSTLRSDVYFLLVKIDSCVFREKIILMH